MLNVKILLLTVKKYLNGKELPSKALRISDGFKVTDKIIET